MKRVLAIVVLGVLGFAVAGCGSARKSNTASVVFNTIGTKSPSGMVVVRGKRTFANLPAGTPIACNGGEPTVTVPPVPPVGESVGSVDGGRWSSGAAVSGPAPETYMRLKRTSDGRVTVSCSRK